MVATYEGLGMKLLYPDNWQIDEATEESGAAGITLESPDGVFFSVNRYPQQDDPKYVLQQAVDAMRSEYSELEEDPLEDPDAWPSDASVELSFYYLDLLITTRILAIRDHQDVVLVQIQGESRDFDRLEPVFLAMMKSLRESL